MKNIANARIRINWARVHKHNPVSGHRWVEWGEAKSYSVMCYLGEWSRHYSLEAAEAALAEFLSPK